MGKFLQTNHIYFWLITSFDVKKRYEETAPELFRQQKSYYFKLNIKGNVVRVCRMSILAVDSLQNERGRLNNILKQIKSWSTPKTDKRGKHCNQFPISKCPIASLIQISLLYMVKWHQYIYSKHTIVDKMLQ